MSFTPGSGAVIRFTVEGAQTAQRQIETIGGSFGQLGTLARTGLAALAAGFAALKIGEYVKDATLLAARYETLGIVMHTAGVNAGYSNAQMDAYAKGLEKSGISMMKAREAMTAMTAANLNNNKSLELGRMAQDLAVVANKSSSETLTDLITNIQQADTEGLKYMGIILNQDEALQKYATSHNTVTKALTQTQKAEAIQAAVMQEGAKYAGIYEKAMGTAGKALNSLDRYFENIKVRLGTPFLEGFAQGVFGVTDGVKQLNKWLDELEKNGAMEKLAKSIGSAAGTAVSVIKDTIEITGQFASGIVKVGQVAAKFFDDYLGGMTTVKYATIAFALLLSGYMVEQAIIGFNAVSASAWGAVGKVGAAFAAMSTTVVTFFTMLAGAASAFGWGAALLMGAKTIVAAVGAAISSIPGAVGAVVVAAGLALGYGLVAVFGDTISKGLDSVMEKYLPTVKSKIDTFIAWVVAKTHDLPEISEAVVRDKPDDVAKAAANKAEKDRKEQLMREMNASVVAAEGQIAITSAANASLKALNDLRDQQLKQSLDQRIIAQADYLQKKQAMDVAEAQGQLNQIAAQKAQLAAYMAAYKAGAPLGQGRDPAADANEMIKLSGEEAAAQTRLNAVKQSYAYQIAGAVIESYTKEFGSIESIVEAQEQLVRVTRQNFLEAGKTAEQRETLGAQRMQSAADELAAELEAKQANGSATKEYVQNTSAMITALNQMGQARLKAVGSGVAISFINDTKAMRDDTVALYADMKNTFLGTEEDRVRAAAAASIRLADIRKQDAYAAIDGTNDTDSQKIAAKKKVLQSFNDYVNAVNQNADAKALQSSRGFETLRDAIGSAFDVSRIESFGQAMTNAFGNAGAALGGLVDALSVYDQQQRDNENARKVANAQYKDDASKLAAAQSAITTKQQREQLGYYGNVASAAKGFFKENSAGYKAMETAEKAFRAFELAIAIKNQLEKLGLLTTFTAAHETATVTQTAITQASVAPDVAASMAKGQAAAAAGVAAQATGDPYSAWARMAAMAAAMAALGFAVSGGGSGPSVSQQRQEAQGTGTVLGDSSAKSASINNAIKLTAANSSTQINYLASMNAALQTIQANIKGFASQLLRTTDVTNPNVGSLNTNNGFGSTVVAVALGGVLAPLLKSIPVIGNFIGKLGNSLFGGKQSVQDSGITMDKTSLAAIVSGGLNAKSYADIKTDGGLFRKDHVDPKFASLGTEANRQFTTIITSMADAVKQAGVLLGMNGDAFSAKLNTFVVDIGKVSLKDLKGDDLQKALEAVFSKLGDQMASFGVAGLQQFQQVGEGYLETLVRVASDYAKVDASLQSIGKTFGAVGLQSIAARENLISLLGGIDDFQSKTADYAKNFLTTAQQLAPVQKYVTDSLAKMGLGWVTTRQQFAGVVAGLDLTTEAGQQTYAALMNLEEAFAATHEAIVDTTKSAQDIADERKDLQDQLDQLTMTSAQLLAKQRAALDDSNKALFDQVQAAQKVKDAQDSAKTSLGSFLTQMKSFATTVSGLNNSLSLGSLTTLTPEQQYAEARRQFEQTRQKAAAGDATAQNNLQSIEQTFLQLSQKLNGGDAQYSSDLASVMHANNDLAKWANQSVDVAQASLDALNDSSATLTDISATLKAIAQGVQATPTSSGTQGAQGYVPVLPTVDYSTMGTSNMSALVEEVKALRASNEAMAAELKGLRADQQKQTGDLIKAGASSADKAAEKVVAGNNQSDTDIEWRLKAAVRKIV